MEMLDYPKGETSIGEVIEIFHELTVLANAYIFIIARNAPNR